MKLAFPDPDEPLGDEWREPLYAINEVARLDPAYQFFDLTDFMVMAKVVRSSRPNIIEYKHYFTRRYLHLDELGGAYRYIPPVTLDSRGGGRFVAAASLEWALDAVLLWELPWLKPGLEKYRFGLSFDERWRLEPRFDPRRFLVDDIGGSPGDADDWSIDEPAADHDRSRLRLVHGGSDGEQWQVPRVSAFYGIAVYMYVGREHPPPHFHAIYGEFEAQVGLDGLVLNGELPRRAASLVETWARLHADELAANWARAIAHEPLVTIEALP